MTVQNQTQSNARLRRMLIDAIDGTHFTALHEGDRWYCDSCSEPQQYGQRATHYLADQLLNEGSLADAVSDDGVKILATYCSTCSLGSVIWPHSGTNEFIIEDTLSEERKHTDVSVVDISRSSEGVPFNARVAWEMISSTGFDEWSETVAVNEGSAAMALRGPENMVMAFLSLGIDPSDLFKDDGSIDPEGINEAKSAFVDMERKANEQGEIDHEEFSQRMQQQLQSKKDSESSE